MGEVVKALKRVAAGSFPCPDSNFGSFCLCQVLAKRIRSGSKPVCKDHPARFWPLLPSRSGADANRIRYVCTGELSSVALWNYSVFSGRC